MGQITTDQYSAISIDFEGRETIVAEALRRVSDAAKNSEPIIKLDANKLQKIAEQLGDGRVHLYLISLPPGMRSASAYGIGITDIKNKNVALLIPLS